MKNAVLLFACVLAGCATREPAAPAVPPPVTAPVPASTSVSSAEVAAPGTFKLRCDDGLELRLRMLQDEVHVEGLPTGREVLLRDAGGVTPQQSVFSSPRVRAEFGLGAQASEAVVHLLQPAPRDLHCRPA
jgi:hypothetical protein